MQTIDFEKLWQLVPQKAFLDVKTSCHGLEHWRRVERDAVLLAKAHGGDETVARLFALFHDSQRVNEYEDPQHGARGAALAQEFREAGHFTLSETQMAQLTYACEHHTDEHFHEDVTISCCWDADRLDLDRVGIQPSARFLNTKTAKAAANSGSVTLWMWEQGHERIGEESTWADFDAFTPSRNSSLQG